MTYMTHVEFARQQDQQKKRNAYALTLREEVEQLRAENAELRAERDALRKSVAKITGAQEIIQPRGIVE